jgi:hypothetical protein
MKTILVNYADKKYLKAQKRQCETAASMGGIDRISSYGRSDLDPNFIKKNEKILAIPKGAGCWIWKPQVILQEMEKSCDGDLLFYVDCGAYFTDKPKRLYELTERVGIVTYRVWTHYEFANTKRDAFVLMDCDSPQYSHTRIRIAAYFSCVVGKRAMDFVRRWISYCEDERVVCEGPSMMGLPEYPGFCHHNCDQSVMSLLAKKEGIPGFCDPSQWGHNDPLHCVNYPSVLFSDHWDE